MRTGLKSSRRDGRRAAAVIEPSARPAARTSITRADRVGLPCPTEMTEPDFSSLAAYHNLGADPIPEIVIELAGGRPADLVWRKSSVG